MNLPLYLTGVLCPAALRMLRAVLSAAYAGVLWNRSFCARFCIPVMLFPTAVFGRTPARCVKSSQPFICVNTLQVYTILFDTPDQGRESRNELVFMAAEPAWGARIRLLRIAVAESVVCHLMELPILRDKRFE